MSGATERKQSVGKNVTEPKRPLDEYLDQLIQKEIEATARRMHEAAARYRTAS